MVVGVWVWPFVEYDMYPSDLVGGGVGTIPVYWAPYGGGTVGLAEW